MTVNLSTLLFRVRASVAEIPVATIDDLAMYRELEKANKFIEAIKRAGVVDADLEIPIICLSAYYSHVNYGLLSARQLGTIDELTMRTQIERQANLKRIAKAQISLISDVELTDELTIADERYAKVGAIAFALSPTVMSDYRWSV